MKTKLLLCFYKVAISNIYEKINNNFNLFLFKLIKMNDYNYIIIYYF